MTRKRALYRAWASSSATAATLAHGVSRYVALKCRCAECRRAMSAYGRKYRTAKAMMGLCSTCTRDRVPGRTRCAGCLERAKVRKAAR